MFGPYLSSEGSNPWGDHVNLDGEGSAEVRAYILDNVRMWLEDYHVDALRLDAVHALEDSSDDAPARGDGRAGRRLSAHQRRPLTLIAESDMNDPRLITPREAGGYGLDAQWSDDFHHAVHVALTGETEGYYADFEPLSALAKVCEQRVLPRRDVVVLPRPRARPADRHRAHARLAAGGLQPEPRPGRQPRARRPHSPSTSTTTSSPARRC